MKKALLISIVTMGVLCGEWTHVTGSNNVPIPPKSAVLRTDSMGVFIHSLFTGFCEEDTTIDNKNFRIITFPNTGIRCDIQQIGKPQLPCVRLLVAVPDSCSFSIDIHPSDYTLYEGYLIYPIPSAVPVESAGMHYVKEVYTYDTAFYQKDTTIPRIFYEVKSDDHWRDQRVLEIYLYPIRYNPLQKLMYFYHSLDLRITYNGAQYPNSHGLGPFEDIGREMLLNYPGVAYQLGQRLNEPAVHYYTDLMNPTNIADYIIVTHNDFLNNKTLKTYIDNIAQWRVDHNFFDVGIVTMQDIYDQFPVAYDSAASLCHFLKWAYRHWPANTIPDGHFAYCLLIGDWDYVPTRLKCYSIFPSYIWQAAVDYYYADLDSNRLIDIMLGRWPVKEYSAHQLITCTKKTINYENNPDTGDWRRRGFLIAGGGDAYDMITFDSIVNCAKPFFSCIGYDTIMCRYSDIQNPANFRNVINNNLNAGEILTIYVNHGGPEAWFGGYDTAEVKNLENGPRLPLVLSLACLTGMFNWDKPGSTNNPGWPSDTSIGEHFLFNENGGAVAFVGATKYVGLPDIKDMLHLLFHAQQWTVGKFLLPILTEFDIETGSDTFYCWCLLGDPALDLGDYTAYPHLPDLVIPKYTDDIVFDKPFPYQVNGDIVPIHITVQNIGKVTAYNVKVKARLKVPLFSDTASLGTINIPYIEGRDSAIISFLWDPTVYNFDNGQQIVLPDGYYGIIGESKFFFIVDPNNEITESWEGNNQTDTLNTVVIYPQGWSRKYPYLMILPEPAVPALANMDASGPVEIVYPGLDSLFIIKADGQNYPDWPKYFHEVYGIVLADLDNNGFMDIVAVSEESLKVYFNYNGLLTYTWSATAIDGKFTGLPAIGRIQPGSGSKDIVVLTRPPTGVQSNLKVNVFDFDGTSPVYIWNTAAQQYNYDYNAGPSIENVYVSGNREVIVSCCGVYPLFYTTEIFNAAGLHQLLNYGRQQVTPALARINADPIPDVLIGAGSSVLHAYDAYNGLEIWQTSGGPGGIFNSPAAGDIHGGQQYPGIEITSDRSQSASGHIRLLNHTNGSDISPYPISVSNPISTSPALAKLEGSSDRNADIVFGSTNYRLYGVNYNTDTIPPFALPVFGIPNSPVIGDIDGDHKTETVFSSSDGYLHVWKNVNSYVNTYQLEWPQFHHNYQRTGLYNWIGGLTGGDANPPEFSTITTISMTLQEQARLNVKIYDVEGNLVKTLVDQVLPSGTYNPTWDGKDNNFVLLPNGVYFIEIKVHNESMITPVTINR